MSECVELTVNGHRERVAIERHWTLLELLRKGAHLLGTKEGCGEGVCGSCTVRMNGTLARSCLVLAIRSEGATVETVEGLAATPDGAELQGSFARNGAVQCGFCTPGMLMSASELLRAGGVVSEDQVREQLSGNICRCGGYPQIVAAVKAQAEARSDGSP